MKKYNTILWAMFAMALWGSLFPMIKIGYEVFSVDTGFIPDIIFFAGLRFVICGAGITGFCAAKKKAMKLNVKQEFLPLLCVGVFSVILHYIFTYTGLTMTESGTGALLKMLGVFVFIPFSFLFFKEDNFAPKKLIGAVCGFAGIFVLNYTQSGFRMGFGEVLIILASVCTVISSVLSKNIVKKVDSFVMTGYSQLSGGMILFLIGILLGGGVDTFSLKAFLVLLYICIASTGGYCIWNYLIKNNDLSKLFIVKFCEPIFAAVFGAMLLGENILNVRFLLALVFTAVAVVVSGA